MAEPPALERSGETAVAVEERKISMLISSESSAIVETATRLLLEVPLCDNCLGRMFALLGRGYTNRSRGESIKRLIVQSLHKALREEEEWAYKALELLAQRLTPHADQLYIEVKGEKPETPRCAICGGWGDWLDSFYNSIASRVLSIIDSHKIVVDTFLLGSKVSREILEKENRLKIAFRLGYAETLGSEIKREVSKRIQAKSSLKPDFEDPDIVFEIEYPSGAIAYRIQPLLVGGRYRKTARRVSQTIWVTRDLRKKYLFSVEESFYRLAEELGAETLILHGAGREDADVRMLGTGRPFVLELKNPKRRGVARRINWRGRNVSVEGFVEAFFSKKVSRKDIAELKEEGRTHSKIYRATIIAGDDLPEDAPNILEKSFKHRLIRQRTPRRVRHRRPDIVRERIVYSVKAAILAPRVLAALIKAEGGLYIKELVDGDGGDTTPSFSSILGVDLYCAELDVVKVDSKLPWASIEYIYNPSPQFTG